MEFAAALDEGKKEFDRARGREEREELLGRGECDDVT